MRRSRLAFAMFFAATIALAPGLADARAGGGSSMGSRGGRTFSAPSSTNTAPSTAAPMQRSMTPAPSSPSGAQFGGAAAPRGGLFGGSPFVSGLMGGLIGAGIGGMLFGHSAFGGMSGFAGFLGLLLQIFLIVMVVRFLFRWFMRRQQPAMAGGPNLFGRDAGPAPLTRAMNGNGAGQSNPVSVQPADFQHFEQLLQTIQAAWSHQDLPRLQAVATPEMVSYFADQLAAQTSRGLRNTVTDVKLDQGDLSEAWAENGREYATVAMRFSMVDVTRDSAGRVVEGDPASRTQATEVWTFVRAPNGQWVLSAIQQSG